MIYSKIIASENEYSLINQFVDKYALVQHSIKNINIYSSIPDFNYKYIACFNEANKIVGVLPFVHYNGAFGDVIHSMPFIGYGGGYALSEVYLESLISELISYAVNNMILLITICTPPFTQDYKKYSRILKPDFEQENFYQYIELDNNFLKAMNSKNRNNLKRNLRIAEKNGVYLKEDYSESYLAYWYEKVYVPRMRETKGAIYPFEVFNELRKSLGGKRLLIQYAMNDNGIIGAGLFLKQQVSLDNFMRVVGSEHQRTNAGILLDYWSLQYAQNNGYSFYNWQSCDSIDSPIFNYKKSWGSEVGIHYYLTKVINPIDSLRNALISDIKEKYEGIYVMPYSKLNS